MRKQRVVGRSYGMKYSWMGHKDRNRRKNRIKKKGWASSVGLFLWHKPQTSPTTWRWTRRHHSHITNDDYPYIVWPKYYACTDNTDRCAPLQRFYKRYRWLRTISVHGMYQTRRWRFRSCYIDVVGNLNLQSCLHLTCFLPPCPNSCTYSVMWTNSRYVCFLFFSTHGHKQRYRQ